jgi:hypothetical protein
MSREMAADDGRLWRAVITVTYFPHANGRAYEQATIYAGPYRTEAAAKTAIKREKRDREHLWEDGPTVDGHTESTPVNWSRHG